MTTTATTHTAREHARAQANTVADYMPVLPASAWTGELPAGVDASALTWAQTVAPGGYSSLVLARGSVLALRDVTGDACAHLLLYNADQPAERLNAADTVKVPWQAYLGPGHPLLSDQGRVLATIVADTCQAHDALCGTSHRAGNTARYGDGAPEGPSPAGRELFTLAAAKHGLTPRDIAPSVSLFQGVHINDDGTLAWTGSPGPGTSVQLRMELPAIVLVANACHPLDPSPEYRSGPLELLAWRGEPTQPDDSTAPETARAYANTHAYCTAKGI